MEKVIKKIFSMLLIVACQVSLASDYEVIPGRFIVKSSTGAKSFKSMMKNSERGFFEKLSSFLQNKKTISLEEMSITEAPSANESKIYEVKVDKDLKVGDLENSLELGSDGWVEPVYKVSINNIPSDRLWFGQWPLKNYGQDVSSRSPEGKVGSDIKIIESWKISKGSRKIKVGVIDTGIDYLHPDLVKNIWVNEKELKGDKGVDDDGNGYTDDVYGWDFSAEGKSYYGRPGQPDPMDGNSHGTHVAGTIGAVTDNTIGISGINQEVSLVSIKFLSDSGSGSTMGAYRSIMYAITVGVDVVNASWGGGGPSRLVKEALQLANKKGILFVAAAGNSKKNADYEPHYPSDYEVDNILSVAATDNNDRLAWFSNYGYRTTDIAAPGVDILSTIPRSSKRGDLYAYFSGTSMASPHVAGVAALVLAHDSSLIGKPQELKERLMSTSDKLPQLAGRVLAGGRLNALRALKNEVSDLPTGKWIDVDVDISTASFPKELINRVWTVSYPGAIAYKVHISQADIDTSYDVAGLFDDKFRRVMDIPATNFGTWSPIVYGKSVHLNFSTALLQKGEETPYASNTSQGFVVDKVSYLVKE